jgi:uncharacterized protein
MSKRLMIIGVMLLFSISTAPAQTPSPEALAVARSLISTMKLTDQYKALLPVILLSIKPALVQGRPEIERDYDAMAAQIGDAYAPYYSSMVDSAASLYASNFTVDELRELTRSTVFRSDKSFCKNRRQSPSRACRSARMPVARRPRICAYA